MERERLGQIVEQYGQLVLRRCWKILGKREDAEDAAQEVFMKVAEKLHTFKGQSSLGTWLYRVATNHCLNLLKSMRSSEGKRAPLQQNDAAAPRPWFDPEQAAFFSTLLPKFDSETSEIVLYYFLDGMTHEEIAKAMSLSRKTVGKRLESFERTCRRLLADEKT